MAGPGLIARAGQLIRPFVRGGRVAVVADETVAGLYGAAVVQALTDAGLQASLVTVPPGEGSKSFAELERLCDRLLALGLDRKDLVVALGGGVIGDLAGFAAAIYMRGVDVVQIPTSLLAQVDSSVGGKTAIDTPRGKNLIGAFWQPRLVLADLDVLSTLPERELKAGWAEVVKYGLLGDAAFFDRLEAGGLGGDLAHAVARSVEMKAEIVAEDPRETGRRALLNLGHTFAHALEAEAGFDGSLLHGEAVAIGMAQAFRLSARLGLCPEADARRAEAALAAAGLPTTMAQVGGAPFAAERLLDHMARDKKAEGGELVLVLARRIGEAFVARGVERAAVRDFLIAEGARP
ncbi:3-dehydroquinate synthase [Caulobacter sp. 17J65-9]|uniref:3-dehydroquinate synthase n=1 Tax=Caulobacter sp. 17J65-9 TaxID=2709382 RepID=UPI0013C8BC9C|nr:3-dehydroquinate synthase [Caulobacter sp. 17J65-9]NEX94868.1 3-dehydroquinate synthase [Caulobacter sp. 17J65-9]